ncbi:MAG: arylsulfatase, partial [Planctomycetales bacterium]
MKRLMPVGALVMSIGGLFGWLVASGRLSETFAQDKTANGSDTPARVVDGSILPFPPTPSASTAGLTIKDLIYKKRVDPKRLVDGAPNVLIILMDDVGPG